MVEWQLLEGDRTTAMLAQLAKKGRHRFWDATQCDRLLTQLSFKRAFQFVFLISMKTQADYSILGRVLSTASVMH